MQLLASLPLPTSIEIAYADFELVIVIIIIALRHTLNTSACSCDSILMQTKSHENPAGRTLGIKTQTLANETRCILVIFLAESFGWNEVGPSAGYDNMIPKSLPGTYSEMQVP